MTKFKPSNRLRIEKVPIDDLTPLHDCPAWHSQRDLQRIAKLIRQSGQPTLIVVDRFGNILSGQGVWRAMKKLGFETVFVVRPR